MLFLIVRSNSVYFFQKKICKYIHTHIFFVVFVGGRGGSERDS